MFFCPRAWEFIVLKFLIFLSYLQRVTWLKPRSKETVYSKVNIAYFQMILHLLSTCVSIFFKQINRPTALADEIRALQMIDWIMMSALLSHLRAKPMRRIFINKSVVRTPFWDGTRMY